MGKKSIIQAWSTFNRIIRTKWSNPRAWPTLNNSGRPVSLTTSSNDSHMSGWAETMSSGPKGVRKTQMWARACRTLCRCIQARVPIWGTPILHSDLRTTSVSATNMPSSRLPPKRIFMSTRGPRRKMCSSGATIRSRRIEWVTSSGASRPRPASQKTPVMRPSPRQKTPWIKPLRIWGMVAMAWWTT